MGNLLFSPNGRINSGDFMKGATLIILITLVFGLISAVSFALGAALSVVTFVFFWCWPVLWVKRYHDGGKSGWMCLVPIGIYIVVATVASLVVANMFSDPEAAAAAAEAAAEAAESGDVGAIFKTALSGSGVTKISIVATSVVGAAVSYGIAFLFNNMIKGDAHDNQFGPNTSTDDVFN